MLNLTQTTVDSLAVLVAGGDYVAMNRLLQNGSNYDLTGKTVTATIRQFALPNAVLGDGDYEDIPVTLGNDEFSAALGGVQFAFSIAIADFPVPTRPEDSSVYYIQYHVVEDGFYPQMLLFGVRRNTP